MPTGIYVVKKILAFWLCYIIGIFTAEGIVILLHFTFGKNIFAGEMFDTQTITLLTYYGYAIIAGIPLLYWKLIEKKKLSEMGLTPKFGNYFIGIILGVLLLAISVFAILITGSIKYIGIFQKPDFFVIFLFVLGFIIQGAAEEILCRGLVLHSLKEKIPVWIAAAISTVMFIIPHCASLFAEISVYSVVGIINLVLISVIFSLLTIRFKNIWAACGLHSFWNAVLYSILGLNLSGNEETVTAVFNMQSADNSILNGGAYGIEASIITTAVLAFAAALIWFMNKKSTARF